MSTIDSLTAGSTVALILLGNIGDVLLLEPVLRALRERGMILDFYCTAETAMVWQGDPRIRQVLPVRSRNSRYAKSASPDSNPRAAGVGRESYDASFDFWPTGRSHKLTLSLRARLRISWRGRPGRRLLHALVYNRRIQFPGLDIRRDRVYLALTGLEGSSADLLLPARAAAIERDMRKFASSHPFFGARQPLVVLQPTARWKSKLWTVQGWRELARRLRRHSAKPRICVISGPAEDERALARAIAVDCIPDDAVFAGTLQWDELRCALAAAAGFIGLDSAPYHLAAMLGKPLVVMFGRTNEKEWGPVLPGQELVKAPEVNGIADLQRLPVETVEAAASRWLSSLPQE